MRGIWCVGLAAASIWCNGCTSDTARFDIKNHSPHEVRDLVLIGKDFNLPLGVLPPGGEREVRVPTRGESGLRVAFASNGRTRKVGPLGYFLAGSKMNVIIGRDGKVAVEEL